MIIKYNPAFILINIGVENILYSYNINIDNKTTQWY